MAFPPISILRKERPLKINECGHTYNLGTGAFIYALSAAETSPLFPASQPQTKPCFLSASNALALSGGNGIFTATPTERIKRIITYYTLLRKVVCQMGRCPIWIPPQQTGAMPLAGSIAPVCCQQPVSRSACSSL